MYLTSSPRLWLFFFAVFLIFPLLLSSQLTFLALVGMCQLLQWSIAYQHKRASVVGKCGQSFPDLLMSAPKTKQQHIETIDVQKKRGGLTHIACAIVLVFLVAAKTDLRLALAEDIQDAPHAKEVDGQANKQADKQADKKAAKGDGEKDEVKDNANGDEADARDKKEVPAPKTPVFKPRVGHLIRVPLPITGEVDSRIKRAIRRAIENKPKDGSQPILILEFWPTQTKGEDVEQNDGAGKGENQGKGSDFSRCLNLARYLTSDQLGNVRTVAYIPRTVQGHAVLVALACRQIIMAPDAKIGRAGIDESAIDETLRRTYTDIANRRRTLPATIAVGMLDKSFKVYRVNKTSFVLEDELQKMEQAGQINSRKTVVPAGEMGYFTGRELRLDYGFVSHLVNDRIQLAEVLRMSPESLEYDPSQGEAFHPIRVDVRGPINQQMTDRIQRSIEDRMKVDPINLIVVVIDSEGGSPVDSIAFANFLASFDSSKIRTVAFVPSHASGDAVLIAMACDHLVMAKEAVLGGPATGYTMNQEEVADTQRTLRNHLAKRKATRWSLWAAMLDPELQVDRYIQIGTGRIAYFCDQELAQQIDPTAWNKIANSTETTPDQPYKTNGGHAKEIGLARFLADDIGGLKAVYQYEGSLVEEKGNWAFELVEALASPQIAWMLLFLGGFAMMAEFSSPGIGIGGFIAVCCFGLFFWSHFLEGSANWLEVLLFIVGVACLLLEIFVLPGFGIFGLGGGAMVLLSIILVTQTAVWHHTDTTWEGSILWTMIPILAMLAGMIISIVVMPRLLPRAPLFKRIVLEPPQEDTQSSHKDTVVDYTYLVNAHGITETRIMPSGKARFGDDLISVISNDGDLIPNGTEVQVVNVQGNRVLVEEVTAKS